MAVCDILPALHLIQFTQASWSVRLTVWNLVMKNFGEHQSSGFVDWIQAAVNDGAVQPGSANENHVEALDERRHTPNLVEGESCKLASPTQSSRQRAQISKNCVATVLATIVALVGILPHTVCAVGTFRLSQDIVEYNLPREKIMESVLLETIPDWQPVYINEKTPHLHIRVQEERVSVFHVNFIVRGASVSASHFPANKNDNNSISIERKPWWENSRDSKNVSWLIKRSQGPKEETRIFSLVVPGHTALILIPAFFRVLCWSRLGCLCFANTVTRLSGHLNRAAGIAFCGFLCLNSVPMCNRNAPKDSAMFPAVETNLCKNSPLNLQRRRSGVRKNLGRFKCFSKNYVIKCKVFDCLKHLICLLESRSDRGLISG